MKNIIKISSRFVFAAAMVPFCVSGLELTGEEQVLAFWKMDQTVKQGSQILVRDELDGVKRREMPLELSGKVISSDLPPVTLGVPKLTSGKAGVSGEALSFDKSYAFARNIWQGYESIILDFWMKVPVLPKTSGAPVIYLLRTGSWDLTILAKNELQWAARNSAGGSVGYVRKDLSGLENKWIHVIAAFEADKTMTLKVDDEEYTSVAKDMWWIRKNDGIQFGFLTGRTVDRSFVGFIDEMKVSLPVKAAKP